MSLEDIDNLTEKELGQAGHADDHKKIVRGLKSLKEETSGSLKLAGTTVGSPLVLKPLGDGRAGVWEFIHNDTSGYLFHLLMGQDSSAGSWIAGIGIDAGLGNGFIFRNKAKGIGLKIEQVASITSATAYGMSVEQKSNLAPAVFMEQKLVTGGAAPLLSLVSYETDTTKNMFAWQGANAKGGIIRSSDGVLNLAANAELVGDNIRLIARSDNTVNAANRHQVSFDNVGVEFARNSGTASVYYQTRIRQNSTTLLIEASANAALGSATYETVISIGNGGTGAKRIGFFSSTAVTQKARVGALSAQTVTDIATAQTAINNLQTKINALEAVLSGAAGGYGLTA